MDIAFRTDTVVINQLASMVSENDVKAIVSKRFPFKKKIRSLVIPTDGIIKGDTLKDSYFSSITLIYAGRMILSMQISSSIL